MITNLATNAALTTLTTKNDRPNVSNLVKKLTITQKSKKLKIELLLMMIMINIFLLKNLISEHFSARLVQANFASKNDFATFVKKADFDDKLNNLNKNVTSNKTKHVLAGAYGGYLKCSI